MGMTRVLAKGQQIGCDFTGLQETRRFGSTTFIAAVYQLFSQVRRQTAVRERLHGVGPAVKESICRMSVYTHQFIDE